MLNWSRLIRFIAEDGKIYRGEPIIASESDFDVGVQFNEGKLIKARVIVGDIFNNAKVTDKILEVKQLLGPLTAEDVPILKCIGLNYLDHLKGRAPPPPKPTIFYKSRTCIADQNEDIIIPKIAQDKCDYEGELCIVIGKTGKDIKEEDALNYVGGYIVGDDVSDRKWQHDPEYAGYIPQWKFSKSFDRYAPLGPALVSPKVIEDPTVLELRTKVNGELRQKANTGSLLFNIPHIISFLSQGQTLEQGTVIMTGTPDGCGALFQSYLKDGDVVEIYIDKIGTLSHNIKFNKE